MDFSLTKQEEEFKKEITGFIARELKPEIVAEVTRGLGPGPLAWEFVRKLGSRGWLAPMLPQEYGGISGTWMQRHIIENTLDYYFFPELFALVGIHVVMPIILMFGTEEQKREYVARIARGEIEFALGYTEPEAGSDLANIDIRAVEDGDCFIINGQKTYNTCCHYADFHWLCARTEVTKPKHQGLSLFIVPMKSPGISLVPIWTIAGERTNQVFYDNVRVPKQNLVGQKNRGFYHMMQALAFERLQPMGHLKAALDHTVKYVRSVTKNGRPLSEDPLVRQRIAELAIRVAAAEAHSYRITWMVQNNKVPDYQASLNKVFNSELEQEIAYTGLKIMGQYGQLTGGSKYAPLGGELLHFFLVVARRTISGGTNEIARTVIAQRGFGLPRS